jgi:hypothetical protein
MVWRLPHQLSKDKHQSLPERERARKGERARERKDEKARERESDELHITRPPVVSNASTGAHELKKNNYQNLE